MCCSVHFVCLLKNLSPVHIYDKEIIKKKKQKIINAFTVIDCILKELLQDSWIQLLPSSPVLCGFGMS